MKREGKALTLGAILAGLLTARAMSDYFAEVTIIERDRYPACPAPPRVCPNRAMRLFCCHYSGMFWVFLFTLFRL